jgi:hypothetical protein
MDIKDFIPDSAVIGGVLALLSFILYVAFPNVGFVVLFIVGIVLMVVGYTALVRQNREMDGMIDARLYEIDERGYIISLDDSYVPYQNEATIETLE